MNGQPDGWESLCFLDTFLSYWVKLYRYWRWREHRCDNNNAMNTLAFKSISRTLMTVLQRLVAASVCVGVCVSCCHSLELTSQCSVSASVLAPFSVMRLRQRVHNSRRLSISARVRSVSAVICLAMSCMSPFNWLSTRHIAAGRTLFTVSFLADRTNGRAYATVLRLSSSSSSVVCRVCNVMYCG